MGKKRRTNKSTQSQTQKKSTGAGKGGPSREATPSLLRMRSPEDEPAQLDARQPGKLDLSLSQSDYERIFPGQAALSRWLNSNRDVLSKEPFLGALVARIRHDVEEAKALSTEDIVRQVMTWARANKIMLAALPKETLEKGDASQLAKLLETVKEGLGASVKVGVFTGGITLKQDGLTASLKHKSSGVKGGVTVTPGIGKDKETGDMKWKGNYKAFVGTDDVKLSAKVDEKKYLIQLTLFSGSFLPGMDAKKKIKETFTEAEAMLRAGVDGLDKVNDKDKEKLKNATDAEVRRKGLERAVEGVSLLYETVDKKKKAKKAAKSQFGVNIEVFGPTGKTKPGADPVGYGAMFKLEFTF